MHICSGLLETEQKWANQAATTRRARGDSLTHSAVGGDRIAAGRLKYWASKHVGRANISSQIAKLLSRRFRLSRPMKQSVKHSMGLVGRVARSRCRTGLVGAGLTTATKETVVSKRSELHWMVKHPPRSCTQVS